MMMCAIAVACYATYPTRKHLKAVMFKTALLIFHNVDLRMSASAYGSCPLDHYCHIDVQVVWLVGR